MDPGLLSRRHRRRCGRGHRHVGQGGIIMLRQADKGTNQFIDPANGIMPLSYSGIRPVMR